MKTIEIFPSAEKTGYFLLYFTLTLSFTILFYLKIDAENPPQKILSAFRIEESIKIDGNLNEEAWDNAISGSGFVQFQPDNGKKPMYDTQISLLYDHTSIYIGAFMYDPSPDSIRRGLGERDDWSMDADFFAVTLDPFNTGLSAYEFWVSASGVQVDKFVSVGFDGGFNWNAVWESEVSITEQGWIAELKIPYSAIRFPNQEVQEWGAIFWRANSRHNEWSTWKHIDPEQNGFLEQAGKIEGIEYITPPARLAFYPYLSTYAEHNVNNKWGYSYSGGMDIKYGLNESFTLDMTLVPDFGQVQTDDKVLNLTPYEVKYDEKRQFFTEGMDLFNRGQVFYSRRIGSTPIGYYDVEDELIDNEEIVENPAETKMINATKLSGRTTKGLGIGLFNAMTAETRAIIEDTITGEKREYLTQAFTNYNMFVLDQSLKNNSYVSFINTNVMRPGNTWSANVTGTEFRLVEKSNNYAVNGRVNISQNYDQQGHPEYGHEYFIKASRVSGKYRFGVYRQVRNNTFNPNDLGYLQRNNEASNAAYLAYYNFKPVWIFLNWFSRLEFQHSGLNNPNKFAQFNIDFVSEGTLKNHTQIGFFTRFFPVKKNDYYEARADGRKFIKPPTIHLNTWVVPDYKKMFGVKIIAAASTSYNYSINQRNFYIEINPRFRLNEKIRFGYSFENFFRGNEIGYVDEVSDYIIFGKRHVNSITNSVNAAYIFNAKAAVNLRLRHYWSTAIYDDFYNLLENGYLGKADYNENNDVNYNAFNIDLIYRWNFAPGSELSVMWKNSILQSGEEITFNFAENLNNTIHSPQTNSFSVKVLYYIDYQSLKRKKKAEG
ncbi:MAG: carbohydrate binding family 9 domain-containing protein [Bacteroidales bacterium]|nr:carbohydrate binding family 9 domain-containing protein [Bacteroidales bacterium]